MNKQELFDKVVTHLGIQKQKSIDPNSGECVYRNSNGLKCAVGCLITDEEYRPEFENKSTYHHIMPDLLRVNAIFLGDLQILHDDYEIEQWQQKLLNIAHNYKLDNKIVYEYFQD